ncbi:MAG: acyl-CoA dehydrogenase family protein [Chloroflexi bacterium]|nr:acyl-CoA dehydrogenase family protein [Chloroflexota bacterium]
MPTPTLAALTEEQQLIVSEVRRFVEKEVLPIATELEHRDEYPAALIDQMKGLGMMGITIPPEYGGLGLPFTTYSAIVEELSRGWMSLGGVINTHAMVSWMINSFGTEEQKRCWLPAMATGEKRAGLCMTEPNAGSDLQAIQMTAVRDGDDYVLNGTKMFVSNGVQGKLFAVLTKTDPRAQPPYSGMTTFIVDKDETPGMTVGRLIEKLGYKGIDTTELFFEDARVPAGNVVGGEEGQGWYHIMATIEIGRINVASRAVGVATAALEDSVRYSKQRRTFGRPIADHQAIQLMLADMATKIEAARLLTRAAAARKDAGERADLWVGMAKLFATEVAQEVSLMALRIHGGYGYTKEMRVERYYRDAPFMLIGEGTNEIQKLVIARNILKMFGE